MVAFTESEIRSFLQYDPETGRFTWLQGPRAGKEAGYLPPAGSRNKPQWRIEIFGKTYLRSRLAWFWMTGSWPNPEVDHRDTDPQNDRWKNLREATRSQNQANNPKQRNNKSGFKGVYFRHGKYTAQIYHDRKKISLGAFKTPEEAHAAYAVMAHKIYGSFARPS